MLDNLFTSVLSDPITASGFFICTFSSLALGFIISLASMYKSRMSSSFIITLALLPAIVQIVIMLVNGNIGAGIAVMGAFNLVRFRSIPGTAKEICSIFMAMAVGLATGMGHIAAAACFTVIMLIFNFLYLTLNFGAKNSAIKELKITIPEDLDYTEIFDDLFEQYTSHCELIKVRTTNMGSLYQLFYYIRLKDNLQEKQFIDNIRCRNGNLEIVCGRPVENGRDLL